LHSPDFVNSGSITGGAACVMITLGELLMSDSNRRENARILQTLSIGLTLLCAVAGATAQTSATGRPCQSTVTGDLEIVAMKSSVFDNTRDLRVWLPPGYHDATNASKTYPVLYLFDGQFLFDKCTGPGQVMEIHVDEALTDLISRRAVQPIIVVGIDNAGTADGRSREYQPYFNPTLPIDDPSVLHGERIPVFMAEDVMPFVKSHYRISEAAENTGVGGFSAGSVAALECLIQRPDLFGLGLLESTSLQFGNGQLIRDTSPILRAPIRVSIGVGTAEQGQDISTALGTPEFNLAFVRLSQQLATNLKAAWFSHPEVRLTVEQGAGHEPGAWAKRVPADLEFLFPLRKP
jgi:enterochelin esterase-like enzyme